jgi:Domain of unknown function (DUF4184)
MPFTLSHPIAIAPLWYLCQRRLDLTALCIGAMVPDLDRFVPMTLEGGHSLRGVITMDLPWAILILLMVRWVIARPFIALLPPYLASCIPRSTAPSVFVAIVSIIVGALSHIVWDSFTHSNGWFVTRYDFLRVSVGRWPLYELLQHGCGVAGLIAIALWIAWELGKAQPQQRPESLPLVYRFSITTLIMIVAMISTLIDLKMGVHLNHAKEEVVASGIVGGITGTFIGFLVYAISFWIWRSPSKKSSG